MSFYKTSAKNRRDKILHAALKLFYSKGYFRTSVHDIREEANVSIGLVYRYFKSKEEIAQALFSEISEDVYVNIEKIVDKHATAHDRCRAIMAYYFDLTEQYPELADFIIFARHKEIMPGIKPVCTGKAPSLIRKVVEDGIKNGEFREMHPAVAAPSVFGVMIRLIQLRLAGLTPTPLPSILDEAWESAWRAVKK